MIINKLQLLNFGRLDYTTTISPDSSGSRFRKTAFFSSCSFIYREYDSWIESLKTKKDNL
jgi:hypothetical protein